MKVLAMPVRIFWMMSNQVHRLMAEEDIRALSVAVHCQSADGSKEYRELLEREMGQVVKKQEVFDEEGWNLLKSMALM